MEKPSSATNMERPSLPDDTHHSTLSPSRPKIGLALSGAVMRGAVHIGVLAALERAAIPIDYVAGVSAGALVGVLYCAGMSIARIEAIAATLRWRNIASLTWPSQGFFSFTKMEAWLINQLGDLHFADLQRPFAVVATDLGKGEPVVFTEGRLAPIIRASSSVPGIVTPAKLEGRFLGDGGVSNNLPVSAARALGADYVIGVDLFVPTIRRKWGPFGFGFAAIETLVRRSGGGIDSADCLISPPALAGASYTRMKQTPALIEIGKAATEEKLHQLQAVLEAG